VLLHSADHKWYLFVVFLSIKMDMYCAGYGATLHRCIKGSTMPAHP
jgi:hypothetical protein